MEHGPGQSQGCGPNGQQGHRDVVAIVVGVGSGFPGLCRFVVDEPEAIGRLWERVVDQDFRGLGVNMKDVRVVVADQVVHAVELLALDRLKGFLRLFTVLDTKCSLPLTKVPGFKVPVVGAEVLKDLLDDGGSWYIFRKVSWCALALMGSLQPPVVKGPVEAFGGFDSLP